MKKIGKKLLAGICAVAMIASGTHMPALKVNAESPTLLKAGSISATEATVTQEQPFAKGTAGSNIFRIPCLITLKDEEHKGTLVAAADTRYTEYRDFGGIDTIASVSTDNGKTWNYSFPIYFPDSNKSAGFGQATTAIDPVLVEGPDGTIYCMADMNPTGVTTLDVYPLVGTGYVTVNGVERLALTSNYSNTTVLPTDTNTSVYEYYVGDFDENGFAKILSRTDHSESGYGVDEWYNLYTVKNGNYVADLTQTQVNSSTVIQQNAFYKASKFHVYNTGYIWCVKSYDGGLSWEDPEILNTQIKRDDGKETALLVSPGQGMVTSDGDIIVGAYDTYNGESASIFYSTDNGKSWKRSNDVNATSSENEIVELPDGTLRMFYRNQSGKLGYADITKDGNGNYTIGSGNFISVPSNSNCNVSAILLEDTTINGKPVILVSNPETPVSWTRVKGRIFVFTLNADNSMNYERTYNVNEEYFAYSCMTELDNGNVGMLWEPGINEASAIRYDEITIAKILGKEIELKLDPEQVYTISNVADEAAEIKTAPDAKVATVTSELEVSEGIIPLYDLTSAKDSSLDSFSKAANAGIKLEEAEFTFQASGSNWKIYNKATNTYLTNVSSANTFFSATADDMKVTASTETADTFTICRSTGSRFVIFYNAQMNFNSNGNWQANYAGGSYDMVLLEKQDTVSEDDIIPGYKRVSSIADGKNYLISYIWSDGSVIVLYPTNGTSAQTKLVGERQTVKTNIITITAGNPGTTTAVVGDITYVINVLDPATNPAYAGSDVPVDSLTAIADSSYLPGTSNEGPASFVLDNNANTHWHTNWNTEEGKNVANRWIGLKLAEPTAVDGIRYLPRNGNGAVTEYKIQYRATDDGEWIDLTSGIWDRTDSSWKMVRFDAVIAKQIRVVGVHTYADSGNDAHMSAAELRVMAAKNVVPTPTETEAPAPVDKARLESLINGVTTDKDAYTEESWAVLEAALESARVVLADEKATQEDVDNASKALFNAALGLVKKPAETEEPTPTATPEVTPTVEPTTEPTVEPTETPGVKDDVTKIFDDVYTDWYTDYVQYVYDNNLMTGIKGTKHFAPNANITKAQVAQVLYNMEGQPEVENQKVFTELNDVYAAEWYANAVAWAYNEGVVTGDLNTKKFNPNADVTREQLALMMFRYAQFKKYDTSATTDYAGLVNAEKVNNWAADGMNWAVGAGLVNGIEKAGVKDLAPQGNASRAQVAAILQRFCENVK